MLTSHPPTKLVNDEYDKEDVSNNFYEITCLNVIPVDTKIRLKRQLETCVQDLLRKSE